MPVSERGCEVAVELDDSVHGLGAAVVRPARGEKARNASRQWRRVRPRRGDLGERAGVERVDDLRGDPSPLGEVFLVVGGAQLLPALPGDECLVRRVGLDR